MATVDAASQGELLLQLSSIASSHGGKVFGLQIGEH